MIHNIIDSDTIAALATPNGRGGISIIKLSGPLSLTLARSIFQSAKSPSEYPRSLIYGHIYDNAECIDEALLCYMPAPRSYTGEDVVEIQAHGGHAVADTVLALLNRRGARPAQPGEFTRRAFLHGRIDLVQAESVMEVVSAETREQLRQAERMLNGRFSDCMRELLDLMTGADALLTMNIDFSDQNQGDVHRTTLQQSLNLCLNRIDTLLQSTESGRRLRHGVTVVLTGPVNSGKSSLFNALLGRKRALVNSRPGTTRDWIEERIELDGFPVNLIDTAGLRETTDEIERDGVSESLRLVESADIVLHLADAPATDLSPLHGGDDERTLTVFSKADLLSKDERIESALYTSTVTGEGIEECKGELLRIVRSIISLSDSSPLLMIERHRTHLEKARFHTNAALQALEHWSEEIASFELHQAEEEIQRITGTVVDIDVLDAVFRSFCIGK